MPSPAVEDDAVAVAPGGVDAGAFDAGGFAQDAFDPDAEALRLAMKVVAKARVARSFARIAAGVAQESAKQASMVLRAYAGAAIAARASAAAATGAAEAPRPDAVGSRSPAGAAEPGGRSVAHGVAQRLAQGVGFERLARAAAEAATEVTAEEVARILSALEAMTAPRPPATAAAPSEHAPPASTSGPAASTTRMAHDDAA